MLIPSSGKKDPESYNLNQNTKVPLLMIYNKDIALLGAFCLFLSAVEYMIPKPLPFMRIGLANLPLMLTLDIFPLPAFLVLVCIKVLGQALITGTLFSYIFLFSLTGTFLSALLMYFLRKISGLNLQKDRNLTFTGISTAGAMVSNLSQLALAYVFIFKENVIYIMPLFLLSGLITGIILGIFCEIFTKRSQWYLQRSFQNCNEKIENRNEEGGEGKKQTGDIKDEKFENYKERGGKRLDVFENIFNARVLFITGLIIMPALLFNPGTEYRVVQFLFFLFLVWLSGKKVNLLFTFFIIAGITAFNLIIPYGKVLFSAGAFKITSGALTAGIHRSVTLCALVMLSRITIRQDLKLPGAFGELLCKSMYIFSILMIKKSHITAKNFFKDIDCLLLELSKKDIKQSADQEKQTKPAGYVILIAVIVISWIPLVINYF